MKEGHVLTLLQSGGVQEDKVGTLIIFDDGHRAENIMNIVLRIEGETKSLK